MPTISPILLDRLSPCTFPLSWVPIGEGWPAVPAGPSPAEPQIRPTMPTISPILLDRLSPCTLPVSWLPISGTLSATAFSTSALNAGSTEATRPRIVTSTSSNGNSDTKAEYARLETSTPPLSSPYFLITPKTNAVGVYRRCPASTFLITRSTGFIRAHLAVVSATAAPHQGGQTRPEGQSAGPVGRA